jgi:hypothetical protein
MCCNKYNVEPEVVKRYFGLYCPRTVTGGGGNPGLDNQGFRLLPNLIDFDVMNCSLAIRFSIFLPIYSLNANDLNKSIGIWKASEKALRPIKKLENENDLR